MSHSLKLSELEKLRRNAIDEGLDALYIVDFVNGRRYFVVDENVWDGLNATIWDDAI